MDERRAIFVAGDDAEAQRLVMGLIEQIGFGPVEAAEIDSLTGSGESLSPTGS